MKSGLQERYTGTPRSKGSAAKLKILSRKAGLGESGSPKPEELTPGFASKNPKSFRINPTKQSSQTKLADSRSKLDSWKGTHQIDNQLEKQQSSSSNIYFAENNSNRRVSGFPSYMIAQSPRR